jgi:hypothetical protein
MVEAEAQRLGDATTTESVASAGRGALLAKPRIRNNEEDDVA